MAHSLPATFPDIRKLQYWWLGFAVLLLAGWLASFLRGLSFTGSFTGALWYMRGFKHTVETDFMGFVLLLAVSCTARKAWWWVAIARIGYKAALLLVFYWNTYYLSEYSYYKDGFSYSCVLLHLEPVRCLLFLDPFRMLTLPALYAYWLFLCIRIWRTPEALPVLRDGNAFVTST
jgi:hypothetical protein